MRNDTCHDKGADKAKDHLNGTSYTVVLLRLLLIVRMRTEMRAMMRTRIRIRIRIGMLTLARIRTRRGCT